MRDTKTPPATITGELTPDPAPRREPSSHLPVDLASDRDNAPEDWELTAPEPAQPDLRQRLAAELHRIADDIVRLELPLGECCGASFRPGVMDSRADLDRWAAYLDSPVVVDRNSIPHFDAKIPLGASPYLRVLAVGSQGPKEELSEVERLRAELAALKAELAGGAR